MMNINLYFITALLPQFFTNPHPLRPVNIAVMYSTLPDEVILNTAKRSAMQGVSALSTKKLPPQNTCLLLNQSEFWGW